MTSMPQLPVNRFTVFEIETNINNGEPINTSSFYIPKHNSFFQRPKWKRKLSIQLSTSVLDIYRTSLWLTVKLNTTDTSELHSIKALLDSRAIKSFIN